MDDYLPFPREARTGIVELLPKRGIRERGDRLVARYGAGRGRGKGREGAVPFSLSPLLPFSLSPFPPFFLSLLRFDFHRPAGVAGLHAGRRIPEHGNRRLFLGPEFLDDLRLIQQQRRHDHQPQPQQLQQPHRSAVSAPPPGSETQSGRGQHQNHGAGGRPRCPQEGERVRAVHDATPSLLRGPAVRVRLRTL